MSARHSRTIIPRCWRVPIAGGVRYGISGADRCPQHFRPTWTCAWSRKLQGNGNRPGSSRSSGLPARKCDGRCRTRGLTRRDWVHERVHVRSAVDGHEEVPPAVQEARGRESDRLLPTTLAARDRTFSVSPLDGRRELNGGGNQGLSDVDSEAPPSSLKCVPAIATPHAAFVMRDDGARYRPVFRADIAKAVRISSDRFDVEGPVVLRP